MNKILVLLEKADQNYSAYLPELEGCIVTGSTIHEIRHNVREAVDFHLEGMKESGLGIPDVFQEDFDFEYKLDIQTLFDYFAEELIEVRL